MSAAGFSRSLALAAAIVPLCHGIPIPGSGQYRNVDYEFAVEIPAGQRACMNSPPCPNHGVWIPLDASGCDADPSQLASYIAVYADYNTAELGNTPAALAAAECRWLGAEDIVWLHDEKISGRVAAGCRRRYPGGHIGVTYIVLRKTDESPLTWIQISADLVTTPARYAADMRVFRKVLSGVWVHPDGPHP